MPLWSCALAYRDVSLGFTSVRFIMGSTDDADRKRRHFSVSPTSTPPKKQPYMPVSEDKKVYNL